MLRQRPMTRFTIDMCVLASALFSDNVRVTIFAGMVSGKIDRASRDVFHRVAAIMPVLTKTLRHQVSAHAEENDAPDGENPGQSEQVPGFLERTHKACLLDTAACHERAVRQITSLCL